MHVLCGRPEGISLSFMRVGHMRCRVDAKFGRLKQKFRNTDADNMADVVIAVSESCAANTPIRHCWEWRKWDEFLSVHFTAINGTR